MAQQLKTDRILFYTIIVMVFFGLVIVYSASSMMAELKFESTYYFILRQLGWAVISIVTLMYFKRMDYKRLDRPIWGFAPLGVILSLLVLAWLIGKKHRWLMMGPASFQPSEFAKPALIIFLAYFIARRLRAINDRHTIASVLLALGMVALMVVGPDFGTAVVLVITAAALFFIAGLEKKYLVAAGAAGLLLGLVFVASKPYRVARVAGYLDPEFKIIDTINPGGQIKAYMKRSLVAGDPTYQPKQSRIAVGSGGALGIGLMQSKQKMLYLPEAHTDYIYAVIGEELGLWGALGVLIGFFVILWRGMRLYFVAPDNFGKYLALGITICLFVQALMNISVVLDLMPSKGIPLPMISYGGSSLLSTLASLGLLLSVSEHAG
jgi:cell division protein FtsW